MKLHGLVGGRAEVCGPETTLRDAADAMLEAGVGSIAVIDGPRLTGILTERDLLRASAEGVDPSDELVSDWMTVDPDVTSPESEVRDAAKWMLEIGYRHLPVMEDGELLGIVSIKDLLWVLLSDKT